MKKKRNSIVRISVRTYSDTGQEQAVVDWSDGSRTIGALHKQHMLALFAAGEREGLIIEREKW